MYNSYDIPITSDNGWVAIVNTGSKIAVSTRLKRVSNDRQIYVLARFGIDSTSEGMYVDLDDVLIAASNVYIKLSTAMIDAVINVVVIE